MHAEYIHAGQQAGRRASWPVGRVLCTRFRGPAVIHLGLPLPTASCGLPADSGEPPSNVRAGTTSRRDIAPFRPCSRWGLPSRRSHLRRWWSLTPPFHPYRRTGTPVPAAVCFLWHFPAGHPGSALPTTLPCGARTFLGDPGKPEPTRPPGQLARRSKEL
jgi:hypothetical protein